MTAQTDATPNSRRSPLEHDRDLPDAAQTDAPERVFFTKVGNSIIPNSERRLPEDTAYVRADLHDVAQAEIATMRGQNAKCREYMDKLEAELRKADPDNLLIMVGSEMRALLAYVATEAQP
jgi:hypothetical protein